MYNSDTRVKNDFVKPEHTTYKSQCYYRFIFKCYPNNFRSLPRKAQTHNDSQVGYLVPGPVTKTR